MDSYEIMLRVRKVAEFVISTGDSQDVEVLTSCIHGAVTGMKSFMEKEYAEQLNRRAGIEQILLDIANGKKELPSREDCRILALKLGTPKDQWGKLLKKEYGGEANSN